jgi:Acetyltransferase (GNAT) domain
VRFGSNLPDATPFQSPDWLLYWWRHYGKYGRLSIGSVILGHAIEEAMREGCEAFDFLKADEPHEYKWGP